jgi:hypothetical protein
MVVDEWTDEQQDSFLSMNDGKMFAVKNYSI